MFVVHATPAHVFYCAGRVMASSRLGRAADGAVRWTRQWMR